MSKKKRLVVIDGKAVFYRGYYAMPNLSASDGTPVGGVYGFAIMAIEALKKMEPDFLCVAWDKPKTNIRRRLEIYPKYKANRKPAPPDFYAQIPILMDLLKAFGMPLYEIDDHEADDIMGTFAIQAAKKGYESILVTGDHDLLQCVSEDTVVAILRKGLTNIDYFNPKRFQEKYGMTPKEFIDYKSMRGDASDNIPGIVGVGEKTATDLITKYHSIDSVYEHLDELKPKLKEKFVNGREAVDIAKQLVTLELDVPIKIDWKASSVASVDPKAVVAKLRELEFRSLINQLPKSMKFEGGDEAAVGVSDLGKKVTVTEVKKASELKQVVVKVKEAMIWVRSADALGREPQFALVSGNPKRCFAIDLSGDITVEKLAKQLQLDGKQAWIGFDVKSALKMFMSHGLDLGVVAHDVRMGAFLINSLIRDHSLSALARTELGYDGTELEDMPVEEITAVAGTITATVWELTKLQRKALKETKQVDELARNVEWPILKVLAGMEVAGISLDTKYLAKMSEELTDSISDLEQQIYGYANEEFNIASPSQLSAILFEKLKLPTQFIKKTKTAYSTAASELKKLQDEHSIISLISAYREVTKLKSTYVDALPEQIDDASKLHTTFSVDVAPTGRLSSHDPNLQNIPVRTELGRKIRTAFKAGKGKTFISADYSQFELRIAAALSGDDSMILAFNQDADIHTLTAASIYDLNASEVTKQQRYSAKAVNFGIMYGQGPHGLSEGTGMSMKEAKEFIAKYFEIRPKLKEYIDELRRQANEDGFVETILGRRRPTPDAQSSNFAVKAAAERAAINMPIQGSAADLTKMAMIEVEKVMPKGAAQILQIHDSVMVEIDEDKAEKFGKEMKRIMEAIYPELGVKLKVDVEIGVNWGEL